MDSSELAKLIVSFNRIAEALNRVAVAHERVATATEDTVVVHRQSAGIAGDALKKQVEIMSDMQEDMQEDKF